METKSNREAVMAAKVFFAPIYGTYLALNEVWRELNAEEQAEELAESVASQVRAYTVFISHSNVKPTANVSVTSSNSALSVLMTGMPERLTDTNASFRSEVA